MTTDQGADTRSIDSKKANAEMVEESRGTKESAELLLQCWPLLRDKSPDELEALNKQVLRKLDWKFLPCVTIMLIMW